jgi:hypothetical protein
VRLLIYSILTAAMQAPADAQPNTFEQSIVACPSGGGVNGYTTIEAMNKDMETELKKIRAGKSPQSPYVFVLCPGTNFNASAVALTPLLSGAVFTCGIMGNPSSNCDFVGGANQVLINEPVNVTNYKLQMVSFKGITFTGFTNAAIMGNAGSNTSVALSRSNFEVSKKAS